MTEPCKNEKNCLNIGIIGLGTVGSGVVAALQRDPDLLQKEIGKEVKISAASVRDLAKKRPGINLDFKVTDDPVEIVEDPSIDLVIELIGGIEPARDLIVRAMKNGKHVVTANKALLASHGKELFDLASKNKCFLGCEGAVAGGIPIIKVIREGLVANKISRLEGIINGTCNFILTGMKERQTSFERILKEAQDKGFAEQDPTFDVGGIDAAQKLTILAALLFGVPLDLNKVSVEGISQIELDDINYAEKLGYRVKHLAMAVRSPSGIELRVHPALVPENHMLANIEREMNAIVLEGDLLGPLLISGAGAGAEPTASSVLADVADCLRKGDSDWQLLRSPTAEERGRGVSVTNLRKITSSFYFRVSAVNEPGILASITKVLAAREISIEAIVQHEERGDDCRVPIVIITEKIEEEQATLAAQAMSEMPGIVGSVKSFRVEKS